MKQEDERSDSYQEYEGQDTGEVMDWKQIVYFGWKEGANIEAVDEDSDEDVYIINGERYEPL